MITIGTSLGPYEILATLGAGGMGEVYRASDSRLGREAAIKVLPANFATIADRLRRFEQEARATSALNHPNILTIHDIGNHEGAPYIVTELLEFAGCRFLCSAKTRNSVLRGRGRSRLNSIASRNWAKQSTP